MVCDNVFGGGQMTKIFSLKQGATKFDLCDTIKLECHEYQTENISESYYMVQEQSGKGKGETKHLIGNLPMKWLISIWVMPVLRKRTLRELISTGVRYMMCRKW